MAQQQSARAFIERAFDDFVAAMSLPMVVLGDRLGLYKAMAGAPALTPAELAARTGTAERYVREWLAQQAAGAYVTYDGATGRFTLPDEHAAVLADESSPMFLGGAFQLAFGYAHSARHVQDAFRTGEGVTYDHQDHDVLTGVERFYLPAYTANLTTAWIPALTGVPEKLQAGARIADVGCGHGVSTLLLAQTYPPCEVVGFDYHAGSIDRARERARAAGLADRARFEVASATEFPGRYDLVLLLDCLHDMGDPEAACRHIRKALDPDGTLLIVDPLAGDRLEDNLTPLGRAYYAASTLNCVPTSLSQPGGLALGAQAGEARLREVVTRAGFGSFRRAVEAPFNLVIEAKP
ncbi:class I SAM-dependent methyltransferase [Mesorhizobium sp.]|uniref:class I SAM-dependent methyltransferase n=1 Tax=Mesorhizobium sp. TaxID=1871066 RepID=UPI000FE46DA2|nr:class I SAM-dependent methyltransferase [Mesorhizobium sp.]RWI72226.1 MAG: class I SAM-dependent methyltransferase [Mesorhizobium sp.]